MPPELSSMSTMTEITTRDLSDDSKRVPMPMRHASSTAMPMPPPPPPPPPEQQPPPAERRAGPSTGPATATRGATSEPSKRTQRSRARAAEHAALMQQASRFRLACIIRFWSRAAAPEAAQLPSPQLPQSLLQPPPPPPPQLPPPPPPEQQPPRTPRMHLVHYECDDEQVCFHPATCPSRFVTFFF